MNKCRKCNRTTPAPVFHRVLAALLLCGMLFPLLPVGATAAANTTDSTDIGWDNNTNVAEKGYVEDDVVFRTANAEVGTSSGDPKRWNSRISATCSTPIADPDDPENLFYTYYTSADGKNASLYKKYLETDCEILFSMRLLIASPLSDGGHKFVVKLYDKTELTIEGYNSADNTYRYTFLDRTGTLPADRWFHLSFHFLPDAEGSMQNATLRAFMQGELTDDEEGGVSQIVASRSGTATGSTLSFVMTGVSGSQCGFALDDVDICHPGDFGDTAITVEQYEDTFRNTKLEGRVTFTLYHTPDVSRYCLSEAVLRDEAGNIVPCTSRTYSPASPATLIFDFSEHPLLPDTTYTLDLGDGMIVDTCGRVLDEGRHTVSFSTRSREGERPAAVPKAEVPEGGYIMPDVWNTGYRCAFEDLVPFREKYPDAITRSDSLVVISESIAKKYNYEFCGFYSDDIIIKVTASSPVYIHDFYMDSPTHGGISGAGSARLTVAWGEATGSLSAFFGGSNITVYRVFCHDVQADHMKGGSGQLIESCYFRDGGTRAPGAHADVHQTSGSGINNIKIVGCRFDVPYMAYEHLANATVFMQPEGGDNMGVDNIQISGNWFNGGGYTVYMNAARKEGGAYMQHTVFSDNKTGCGYVFGRYTSNGWPIDEMDEFSGNVAISQLYTGSVILRNGVLDADSLAALDRAEAGKLRPTRITSLGGLGTETPSVLLNFANYTTSARTYRVVVTVVDTDGKVTYLTSTDGQIERYTPPSEYNTDDNKTTVIHRYEDGTEVTQTALINIPHFPVDEVMQVPLYDLPDNLEGASLQVAVYETTDGKETMIRSSVIDGEGQKENTLLPETEKLCEVKFVTDAGGGPASTQYIPYGGTPTSFKIPWSGGASFRSFVDENGRDISQADMWNTVITRDRVFMLDYTRSYTVTFCDKDGAPLTNGVLSVTEHSAVTPPTAPAVEGYTFCGWDAPLTNITKDREIHPIYCPEGAVYTVTYLTDDGSVISRETVAAGGSVLPPEQSPEKEGYVFVGWSQSTACVTADVTVSPLFVPLYTVRFYAADGVTLLSEQTVREGASAVPPTPADREGYVFAGWSENYEVICADTDVVALYDKLYTVRFYAEDGVTLLSEQSVREGTSATAPTGIPKVEGKVFYRWSQSFGYITKDTDVTAIYKKLYTVRYIGPEGELLSEQAVPENGTALPPTTEFAGGWQFVAWSSDGANIKADTTITAICTRAWTVRFLGQGGVVLSEQTVSDGAAAAPPQLPQIDGYDCDGWNTDGYLAVYGNLTVEAVYTRLYTVSFLGYEDVLLDRVTVRQGAAAVPPTPPETEGNCRFAGWDTDAYLSVTCDLTVRAKYARRLTVRFLDKDGAEIESRLVFEGDTTAPPEMPAVSGMVFAGWRVAGETLSSGTFASRPITADTEAVAIYLSASASFTVRFFSADGYMLTGAVVQAGQPATPPTPPQREGFRFVGWDKDYTCITENTNIYPLYEPDMVSRFASKVTAAAQLDAAPGATLAQKYEALRDAIAAYAEIPQDQKPEAAAQLATLQQLLDSYNQAVRALNAAAEEADNLARATLP